MKRDDFYTARLFLDSVLPLFKELAMTDKKKLFQKQSGVIQVSVKTTQGIWGTHFILDEGEMTTVLGVHPARDVELHFGTLTRFNDFFKGTSKRLPKIIGFRRPKLLAATFITLLRMASLLGAKTAPKAEAEQKLLVKMLFYLLSSGISTLNKADHPEVKEWTRRSPDRVYAWSVDSDEDLAAHIRIKAGKSRSARGRYLRSQPFLTMRFNNPASALGILLQTEDLLAMTMEEKLVMEGAPEYGAKLGDLMMLVGSYIQE